MYDRVLLRERFEIIVISLYDDEEEGRREFSCEIDDRK